MLEVSGQRSVISWRHQATICSSNESHIWCTLTTMMSALNTCLMPPLSCPWSRMHQMPIMFRVGLFREGRFADMTTTCCLSSGSGESRVCLSWPDSHINPVGIWSEQLGGFLENVCNISDMADVLNVSVMVNSNGRASWVGNLFFVVYLYVYQSVIYQVLYSKHDQQKLSDIRPWCCEHVCK